MARYRVEELEGALLDAAVAMIEGIEGLVEKDGRMCHVREWDPEGMAWRDDMQEWVMWIDYAPSQRWDHGGPIIERERIAPQPERRGDIGNEWADRPEPPLGWEVDIGGKRITGPTHLIAAMRAFCASRFGEEVELP